MKQHLEKKKKLKKRKKRKKGIKENKKLKTKRYSFAGFNRTARVITADSDMK